MIQLLLGVLNIVGGATWLVRRYFPRSRTSENSPATPAVASPIADKTVATQTALNCVAIAFGISVLAPGLLPGLLVAGILVVNGLLLFRLASLLHHIAGPQPS